MSSSEDLRPPVLLLKCPPAFQRIGEQHFTSHKFRYLKSYDSPLPLDDFLTAHAQSVRAILSTGKAPIPAHTLRLLPNVRAIVTTSAGLNHLDLPECRRRGIKIANAGDVFSADGADYAVGLLIDVLRKVSAANRYVRDGFWASNGDYCSLGSRVSGKRIGIVGLGKIGHQVAKRLNAFNCSISYNSRTPKPNVPYPYYQNVREMAHNCDALILCCGLTEHTRHMIDGQVMEALGKEGVIINVARGAVVDEQELVRRLVEGEIGGAGLDVFENEPDVPRQLKELDNVVVSPHCGIASLEAMMDLSRLVVGNLEAFFDGRPLLSEYLDD